MGYVLGIREELLPESLEEQEEFMLSSMLHQGCPEVIEEAGLKRFIDAFARQGSKATQGVVPFSVVQSFLYQMTVYLNSGEYMSGAKIEDRGPGHWSVRLVRLLGWLHGTLLPRLPLGERLLFRFHTSVLRRDLARRGTPTGHGAGTGKRVPLRSKL